MIRRISLPKVFQVTDYRLKPRESRQALSRVQSAMARKINSCGVPVCVFVPKTTAGFRFPMPVTRARACGNLLQIEMVRADYSYIRQGTPLEIMFYPGTERLQNNSMTLHIAVAGLQLSITTPSWETELLLQAAISPQHAYEAVLYYIKL